MKIQAQPRDVHPEGTFTFTWKQFSEPRGRSIETDDGTIQVNSIRAGLQSEKGQYVWDGFDLDGTMAWRLTAAAEATFGRRFSNGETFDTDELLGRQVTARVEHNEGASGTFTNLRDFTTAQAQVLAKAAKTVAALPRPKAPVRPVFPKKTGKK